MTMRALVLVLACGVASIATAQPRPALHPEAQRHLDAGLALYAGEDFEAASRELEAAYRIDPAPALLYAWAQAKRYGGRCREALDLYRRYLAAELNDAQVTAAKAGIDACEKELAAAPPPEPPKPEPPPPPTRPALEPPPPPHVDRLPAKRAWYRNTAGNVLTAGGAIGIGLGIGFLVAAERSQDRADHAEFRDDFAELLDEVTLRRRIGIAALGVGSALVAGGIVSFLRGRDRDSREAIVLTSDGSSVLVMGWF